MPAVPSRDSSVFDVALDCETADGRGLSIIHHPNGTALYFDRESPREFVAGLLQGAVGTGRIYVSVAP